MARAGTIVSMKIWAMTTLTPMYDGPKTET